MIIPRTMKLGANIEKPYDKLVIQPTVMITWPNVKRFWMVPPNSRADDTPGGADAYHKADLIVLGAEVFREDYQYEEGTRAHKVETSGEKGHEADKGLVPEPGQALANLNHKMALFFGALTLELGSDEGERDNRNGIGDGIDQEGEGPAYSLE